MSRQRAPYANRSVWYAVLILAVVVVIGFAGAGYELNHLRTEVNSLSVRVNGLSYLITLLETALHLLQAQIK
jgi:hypothetical protein